MLLGQSRAPPPPIGMRWTWEPPGGSPSVRRSGRAAGRHAVCWRPPGGAEGP